MKFNKVFKYFCKELRGDEELYYSYSANIAMSFKDECYKYKKNNNKKYLSQEDIHIIANTASQNFLNLLIK